MKKFLFIGLFLFCFSSYAEEVAITGICDGEVFIDDRSYRVGDTYQDLTIRQISEDAVTFQDSKGQIFTQSLALSPWESFVVKVREFFGSLREKLHTFSQGASKRLSDTVKPVDPSRLSIEDKMRLADDYLEKFRQESNAFLKEAEGLDLSEQQAMRKSDQFTVISRRFYDRLNTLKLPCPYAAQNRDNPHLSGYLRWSEDFGRRANMTSGRAEERLKRILTRAGIQVF